MTLELWLLIEVKNCIFFVSALLLSFLPIFLKCLLVYIGFNLKCLLVYIFSGLYVKIYKIKSGFGQIGGTYVFL